MNSWIVQLSHNRVPGDVNLEHRARSGVRTNRPSQLLRQPSNQDETHGGRRFVRRAFRQSHPGIGYFQPEVIALPS